MDEFRQRLITSASTIDELLSDEFETLPGQKGDSDRAARRLAAWCRSCASGDWDLFARRLACDGWDFTGVLGRLASVRRKSSAPIPGWVVDAEWIDAALRAGKGEAGSDDSREPCAFEELWVPVVVQAQDRLWSSVDAAAADCFTEVARAGLGHVLLRRLCELSAPAVYGLFEAGRTSGGSDYGQFIEEMTAGGLRQLLESKPVLVRLVATVTRQWIDSTAELATRLANDLSTIYAGLLGRAGFTRVARVIGDVGDLHNGGRSVLVVVFEGGARILYKPKDLGVDIAWHSIVERLNRSSPPVQLRAVRALAREGYGWTEFVEHAGCTDSSQVGRYFTRAGAWLALFYCFGAGDMHHENIIAAGEHPVPIDIETILQAHLVDAEALDQESRAGYDAMQIIANSAMSVGMIPSYVTAPDDSVRRIGGLISDWNNKAVIRWQNVNTDMMQPVREWQTSSETPNLPHTAGRYANLAVHIEDFVSGFEAYARFLTRWRATHTTAGLYDGFAGLVIRHVRRPTRFYSMLLKRLQDHRSMEDGAVWSAQADFLARLSDWSNNNDDHLWPLLKAERSELIELNIPYFTVRSDTTEIHSRFGSPLPAKGTCGMDRAMNRMENLDEAGIQEQVTVIRQNLDSFLPKSPQPMPVPESGSDQIACPPEELLLAEVERIATELSASAIRRGPGAAWIALEWVGDADAFQLTCLGPDLYNGGSGIAVFLAAHDAVTGCEESGELARAAVAQLRKRIGGSHGAQLARRLGVGGATGVGSVVYALTVIAKCLRDDTLLADAHRAAALITDDLIGSDVRLDVVGGSAGAILALLNLHRHSPSPELIAGAIRCGEHLLSTPRVGSEGQRTWSGQGPSKVLTGMSHGAAGYSYALAELASATGRADFAAAAVECLAFENSSYDRKRQTWPQLRLDGAVSWPCQWCHGAPGIGLARIAVARLGLLATSTLATDIERALAAVENGWVHQTHDTLCCGTLGTIEFLTEAQTALGRCELGELARQRLIHVVSTAAVRGDYRWIAGRRQFNPGLFRGLAGVGYSILRQLDPTLPNVLLWD